jgi:hypothetical protein
MKQRPFLRDIIALLRSKLHVVIYSSGCSNKNVPLIEALNTLREGLYNFMTEAHTARDMKNNHSSFSVLDDLVGASFLDCPPGLVLDKVTYAKRANKGTGNADLDSDGGTHFSFVSVRKPRPSFFMGPYQDREEVKGTEDGDDIVTDLVSFGVFNSGDRVLAIHSVVNKESGEDIYNLNPANIQPDSYTRQCAYSGLMLSQIRVTGPILYDSGHGSGRVPAEYNDTISFKNFVESIDTGNITVNKKAERTFNNTGVVMSGSRSMLLAEPRVYGERYTTVEATDYSSDLHRAFQMARVEWSGNNQTKTQYAAKVTYYFLRRRTHGSDNVQGQNVGLRLSNIQFETASCGTIIY